MTIFEALAQHQGSRGNRFTIPQQEADEQDLAQPGNGGTPKLSKARVANAQELVAEVLANAYEDADQLGQFICEWADHLEAIGCPPTGVLNYFQQGDRTLATLHWLVAQPGNPSPTEMLRLALRYALDARKPIEGGVNRFILQRESEGWRIEREEPVLRRRLVVGIVKNRVAVPILDCVQYEPPLIFQLMSIIERQLGGVPGKHDTLPPPGHPVFSYEFTEGPGGSVRVQLWVDDRKVPLDNWRHIHELLHELCLNPAMQDKGSDLEKRLNISNASQAVTKIREALEGVHPGAGIWLRSNPIGWAEGHSPIQHLQKSSRGRQNKKK